MRGFDSEWDPIMEFCEYGNSTLSSVNMGNFFTSWATGSFSRSTFSYTLC